MVLQKEILLTGVSCRGDAVDWSVVESAVLGSSVVYLWIGTYRTILCGHRSAYQESIETTWDEPLDAPLAMLCFALLACLLACVAPSLDPWSRASGGYYLNPIVKGPLSMPKHQPVNSHHSGFTGCEIRRVPRPYQKALPASETFDMHHRSDG
jgi:hypothetical protein